MIGIESPDAKIYLQTLVGLGDTYMQKLFTNISVVLLWNNCHFGLFLLLRSYIPGAGGRGSPRVDRCYSPPPPDIERVITYLVSEDFYIKKQSNEVCHSIACFGELTVIIQMTVVLKITVKSLLVTVILATWIADSICSESKVVKTPVSSYWFF